MEVTENTVDPMTLPSTHRVKLYQLNVDTNWEDKGTGYCIFKQGVDGEPDQLIVESEEDKDILLRSNIIKRRLYQRQEDTLIVWTEDDSRDLALSFQDPIGREDIWQHINGHTKKVIDDITLPMPELSNLKEINHILCSAHTLHDKDRLSSYILTENYIDTLIPLFETCEDLEDIKDLHLLYRVMMGILTLNDQSILEQVVSDDLIMDVMGILEYNPTLPLMKAKHREFIQSRGNAKQLLDLKDEDMAKKIDQTFRLEYLQGILLNTDCDEGLMGVINNVIYQNHVDIINYMQTNHVLLSHLFSIIKDTDNASKRRETIRFIQQLCLLTKQMQNSVRINLYRSLTTYGLLDMMSYALSDTDKSIRLGCLHLLASFTDLDISFVRSNMLLQSNKENVQPLLEVIVSQFTADDDYETKVQYYEILRLLLDPNGTANSMAVDSLCKQEPETDEFLSLFYDNYTTILLSPIKSIEVKPIHLTGDIELLEMTPDQAQLRLYICEFVNFAIKNHGFRSKYMMLSSDFFLKVTQLYRSRYAYIKLGALRFFRVCVSLSDDFYNRNLTKFNVFEPIIRVLLDTQGKDNLLNSACLDLLEYIRRENIKPLISHLISQFGKVLDTITYISTCAELRKRYEQNNDDTGGVEKTIDTNSKEEKKVKHDGWSSSTVDDDEEEYFNGSDEEELPKIPPHPLVNYEDEEEDTMEVETTTAKRSAEHIEEDTLNLSDTSSPPLPFFARKDKEDEDDVLARPSSLQSPTPTKKIVIKTNIKRMRTSQ